MPGGLALEELDLVQRYILVLLRAQREEHIPAKLWLQKELFLLSRLRENLGAKADFVPYLKGPFSDVADGALVDLRNLGLVEFARYGYDIRLTVQGHTAANELHRSIPDPVRKEIEDTKGFLNSLSEDELLVFTYYSYPEMVTDSVVKKHVAEVRLPRAVALYRRGKITLEKAAELGGVSLLEFKKRVGGAPNPA